MKETVSKTTQEKLNGLLTKLESAPRLQSSSEASFFIFDYPPEDELLVRNHLDHLIIKAKPKRKITEVNIFELAVEVLKNRKLLEPSIKLQKEKGEEFLLKAIAAPLSAERLADYFMEKISSEKTDLIFLTGIGSVFPLVRAHSLLYNIAPRLKEVPLILFYPGSYDEKYLTLFNRLKSKDYYQAFRLA